MPEQVRYCPAPGVAWAVEQDGILLTRPGSGEARRLRYPEAAAWDWLSRGETLERVVLLTGLVGGLEATEAERLVREAIASWVAAGFLAVEGVNG